MPREYDDAWVKKQLDDQPPRGYKLLVTQVMSFLAYRGDVTYAMTACYNYGFRRGRNYEKNRAGQ